MKQSNRSVARSSRAWLLLSLWFVAATTWQQQHRLFVRADEGDAWIDDVEQCSEDTRLFELEHAETLGAATENYTASIMQTVLIGPDANVTLLFYSPFEKHFLKEACEAAGGQFTRNPKGSVVLCSYEETGATFALPDFVTCAATTEACEAVLAEDSYWRLLYNVKTLVSTGAECAFVVTDSSGAGQRWTPGWIAIGVATVLAPWIQL